MPNIRIEKRAFMGALFLGLTCGLFGVDGSSLFDQESLAPATTSIGGQCHEVGA